MDLFGALFIGICMGYMLRCIYESLSFSFEDDMETLRTKHDPADAWSCECGNRHPMVEQFGKCGSCWDRIHGHEL